MPWLETNPMRERHHFVQDLESGQWTMTELCVQYGISRKTGYKWLHRYHQSGVGGLRDETRAPRSCPHQTPAEFMRFILDDHTRFGWGARKIHQRLRTQFPDRAVPPAVRSSTSSRGTIASGPAGGAATGSTPGPRRSQPRPPTKSGPWTSRGNSGCAPGRIVIP